VPSYFLPNTSVQISLLCIHTVIKYPVFIYLKIEKIYA
jgi:hypothetical protein